MDDKDYQQNIEHYYEMVQYTQTEEFQKNIENQGIVFEQLYAAHRYKSPFNDWDGFIFHYAYVRAGISSLLKNPDTMNDPGFLKLCEMWRSLRNISSIQDFYNHNHKIEDLYNKLLQKPVFEENSIFRDLYGNFVKSIYQLFTDSYYTESLFEIDY